MRYAPALCLLLAACASAPPPVIQTHEVKIEVPVYCSPTISTPEYPDTPAALNAAANIYERVKLIVAARALRIAHEAELLGALKACEAPK